MPSATPQRTAFFQAIGYAWQFGYTIVVPLIVLGIGGRWLDRKFGTHPWLFLAGVVVSIAISSIALTIKALKIMRSIEPNESGPKDASPETKPRS
jgi:hypothetical protein